jgi:hypothetical protein
VEAVSVRRSGVGAVPTPIKGVLVRGGVMIGTIRTGTAGDRGLAKRAAAGPVTHSTTADPACERRALPAVVWLSPPADTPRRWLLM